MTSPQKRSFHWLLWLLAGGAAIGLAWMLDDRVDAALLIPIVHNNTPEHWFAELCSKLAEGWVPAVGGIFFIVLFMLLHRPVVAAKIFFVVLTCEITGVAALILRVLAGRARPTAQVPQGFYGVWHDGHWIIGQHDFSSFPSGHSATAVGLAAAAWLVHRGWGGVAALFALAVMWARVALHAHHLSDVVASAVLAIPLAVMLHKKLYPAVELQFKNMGRQPAK